VLKKFQETLLCKLLLCLPIALNEEGVDAAVIEKEIEIAKIFCVKKVNQKMLDNIAKVNWLVSLKITL
jgi:hypothetical protein